MPACRGMPLLQCYAEASFTKNWWMVVWLQVTTAELSPEKGQHEVGNSHHCPCRGPPCTTCGPPAGRNTYQVKQASVKPAHLRGSGLAAVAAAATALVSGVGWLTLTGALGRVQRQQHDLFACAVGFGGPPRAPRTGAAFRHFRDSPLESRPATIWYMKLTNLRPDAIAAELLTAREVAERRRVTERTVRNWCSVACCLRCSSAAVGRIFGYRPVRSRRGSRAATTWRSASAAGGQEAP
jgi:hypothetical protein